jgi:YD repeat-containing protein
MRWARDVNAPIVNGRKSWTIDKGFNEQLVRLFDAASKPIGWLLTDPDGSVEAYSIDGRLLSITAADGRTSTLTYSNGNRSGGMVLVPLGDPRTLALPYGILTQVTDSLGRTLKFAYDDRIRLAKVTTPANQEIVYGYDAAGNLASVTYPDGHTRQYLYNEPALTSGVSLPYAITGLIDENGVRLGSYAYDSVGRVVQSQWWADAARTRAADPSAFSYSTSATTVTDGLGAARTYNFALVNGRRVLTSQSQPGGSGCGPSSSAITYDANANVASRTDFNGVKTCYAYDLSRNLETRRVEGVAASVDCATAFSSPPTGARVISTQWHPDWRLETRIAEPNKITAVTYNGQGASCAPSTVLVDGKPPAVLCAKSEQATTDATGALGFGAGLTGTARTWSYTYATYGRVLSATDPNGKTTTTTYYPDDDPDLGRRGNVASITNAATHVTRITAYNLHGQPTQIVDPNGLVTDLTYDARMRLKSRKVGNELTGFTYDPRGLLTTVTLPDGASLTYTYDSAHRLIAIADQQNNRIDYTLDAMGNRVSERASDSGGTLVKNIQRTIDALNRVQQVVGAQ